MNTSEIKQKISSFQGTLALLQKEEKSILEELKLLGINSVEEAQEYVSKISDEDISKLELEIVEVEKEITKWMS